VRIIVETWFCLEWLLVLIEQKDVAYLLNICMIDINSYIYFTTLCLSLHLMYIHIHNYCLFLRTYCYPMWGSINWATSFYTVMVHHKQLKINQSNHRPTDPYLSVNKADKQSAISCYTPYCSAKHRTEFPTPFCHTTMYKNTKKGA